MALDLVLMKSKPTYGNKGAKIIVDKKPVGTIYWTYNPQTKTLIVDFIKVSVKNRKQGYAKAAVKALIKDHPMATQVKTTTIRKSNKGSIALFKGLGFDIAEAKNQLIAILKKKSQKVKPGTVLLFRLFVVSHFRVLLETPIEKQSKKEWIHSTLKPAFVAFAEQAVDTIVAPPKLKSSDELFLFHFHTIQSSFEEWKKNGLLKRNAKTLSKIYAIAYAAHKKNKGPIDYQDAWEKADVLIFKKIH